MDAVDVTESVLARFASANPELPNGFAEHVPMGVDAMFALGIEPDVVAGWAARHRPVPIEDDAMIALRRRELRNALDDAPWADVVRRELAALAPHVGAHLFHGLIRTAHAVRMLDRRVTEVTLDELACGLAAWHVWAGSPDAPATPAPGTGSIESILDAARRGAGACAASPTIVNIHAVTGPMAFTLLAPVLDTVTIATAASAFERTHARHPDPTPSVRSAPPGAAELTRLAEHWDAHPAKLVEAALRGFDATGEGVFLDAAAAIMGS